MTAVEERFWAKVDKNGPVPAHDPSLGPCWLWTGYIDSDTGYGKVKVDGKTKNAHKVAFVWENGPLASDARVDHKCFLRSCVRRSHMQETDARGNQQNRAGAPRNSTTGERGVSRRKDTGKWRAYANIDGRQYGAGNHDTKEQAVAAARELRLQLMTNNTLDRIQGDSDARS